VSLDVLSERGQQSVLQEDRAIELFEENTPNARFIRTNKSTPALLDGIILIRGELSAVAEVKCRNETLDRMVNHYRNEWLLTADKVFAGFDAHRLFSVGTVGLLYLVPDDLVMVVWIIRGDGQLMSSMRMESTRTQRTINGGSAVRNNCYINLTGARICRSV